MASSSKPSPSTKRSTSSIRRSSTSTPSWPTSTPNRVWPWRRRASTRFLADYYLKHGEPSSALAIYRKISELDPQSINVHVKLADLYSQNNQVAEALKEYDRVGRLLLKRGMLDEAVQVFRKALKIDPKNTELVDSLVTALLEAKDFDNARHIVDAALEVNPNGPRLLAMLARIQLGRGDNAGARATLERAVAADPKRTIHARDRRRSLSQAERCRPRAGNDRAAGRACALPAPTAGAAIEMFNRILRVEPGHAPTLERLVATYSRLNEEDERPGGDEQPGRGARRTDALRRSIEGAGEAHPARAAERAAPQQAAVRPFADGRSRHHARARQNDARHGHASDGDRRAGAGLRLHRGDRLEFLPRSR